MRDLYHFIIKSDSNRTQLMPVYIHYNCKTDLDLDVIVKLIESNLDYIETCARCETSLLQFRDQLTSPFLLIHEDQNAEDQFKIHFTTKKQSKYYTTIKFDTEAHGNSTLTFDPTALYLCAFELYLFINL